MDETQRARKLTVCVTTPGFAQKVDVIRRKVQNPER